MSDQMQEKRYSWANQQPMEQQMQQNEFESGKVQGLLASSKRQRLLPEDESRPSDAVDEVRKSVDKRMPKSFEFTNRGLMLESGEYFYKDGNKTKKAKRKVKDKSSMKAVVDSLKALDTLLALKLDLKKKDKIRNAFLEVCHACETYVNKKNPYTAEGKARKQMVKDFYDQVSWESMRFEQILEGYEGHEDELKDRIWIDVLADVRVEKYEDKKDGVKVEMGGAGTSDVFIIEKDGKKWYFKEQESIPSKDLDVLFKQKYDEFKKEEITGKDDEEKTKKQKEHDRRDLLIDAVQKALKENYADKNNLKEVFRKCTKVELMYQFIYQLNYRDYIENEEDYNDDNVSVEEQQADMEFLAKYFFSIRRSRQSASLATGDAKISSDQTITKRNVAAARIAKLLGVEGVIVKSKMVDLIVGGKKRRGVLMDEAKGEEFAKYCKNFQKEHRDRKIDYSPEAIGQITSLQVLDLICGQVDRHDGNYVAEYEINAKGDAVVKSIQGIDNDMCCGKIIYNDIASRGKIGYNRIKNIELNGKFMLPAIEFKLAAKIFELKPEILDYQLCDLLSKEERVALIDRFMGVKKALLKMLNEEKKKNINPNDENSIFTSGEGWKLRKKQLEEAVQKGGKPAVDRIYNYTYMKAGFFQKAPGDR